MSSTKIIYLHFHFHSFLTEGRKGEAWKPSNKLILFLSAAKVSLTCLFPLLYYYIASLSTSLGISGTWTLGKHGEDKFKRDRRKIGFVGAGWIEFAYLQDRAFCKYGKGTNSFRKDGRFVEQVSNKNRAQGLSSVQTIWSVLGLSGSPSLPKFSLVIGLS
jgi:hypothetical protein